MTTAEDKFPDHGDPEGWAHLDTEETRCLTGLRNYYIKLEGHGEKTATELAWADLKREFVRLQEFTWFI